MKDINAILGLLDLFGEVFNPKPGKHHLPKKIKQSKRKPRLSKRERKKRERIHRLSLRRK